MIDFLARYEAHILYAYLPIEIMAVIAFIVYCRFVVWLFKAFKRPKNDNRKNLVHLFLVLPTSFFKLYGRYTRRYSQRRKEKQLDIMASGKVGVRVSDLDNAIFDVVA